MKKRLIHKDQSLLLTVGVTGFEPATTRPPDVYSNRAELHPAVKVGAKVVLSFEISKLLRNFVPGISSFYLMTRPMNLSLSIPQDLNGKIRLPASKSISNRMLVINELSGRAIRLDNISDCDDTLVRQRALGHRSKVTDIMAAGTSMRFLTAYFACTPSDTTITGTERMRHRPIHVLVDALNSLGAHIAYVGQEGYPPLYIKGHQLQGGEVSLPGNVSSQYISALLMAAPTMKEGLTLRLTGDVISRPYINITLNLMRQFGIEVEEVDDRTFKVGPGQYHGGEYLIENDWSGASYWYEMLALSHGGTITLEGLFADSMQGDSIVAELFEPLGVSTTFSGHDAILTKREVSVEHYERDLQSCPDLAQTMVATCCAMNIPFRFSGLRSLRIKETDRLLALRQELQKLGYVVEEEEGSTLKWHGRRLVPSPHPAIDTYEDHRMAMCMAPLAAVSPGLTINNAQVVSKSYPGFWDDMRLMGADIDTLT